MKTRTIASIALALSGLTIGFATQSTAGPPSSAPASPASVSATPPTPSGPVPPLKPMPAGAKATDVQKALAEHAAKSGDTYTVDSAAFDPVRPVRPHRAADGDVPADMPPEFSYLNRYECRSSRDGEYSLPMNDIGRIVNHYQWCGWKDMSYSFWKRQNGGLENVGNVTFRVTILGWGSNTGTDLKVTLYIDDIRNAGGVVTPENTTVTFRPFCENVFNASCEFAQVPPLCPPCNPAPSRTVAALKVNGTLGFTNTVTLPAATTENPDALAAFMMGINFEATSTAVPGYVSQAGALKPTIRCDNAIGQDRGGFTTSACIFSDVLPQYSLSVADPVVGEVAQHIRWAQTDPDSTTPLPGMGVHKEIPALLHRETDPVRKKRNRDVATGTCDSQLQNPRPPGKECDEYPFASSEEGAAGVTDYSVALIDGKQNGDEGTRRGLWYKADRILDADQFLVVAYD